VNKDRSRFFRRYYAGLRIKSYFFSDKIRGESLEMATNLYLALSTLNVRDEALAVVQDAMLSKGMRTFIDDDPDVARTLALVGIVNAFSADATTIRVFGKGMLGIEEDEVAAAMQKLQASAQFPLVVRKDEALHALV